MSVTALAHLRSQPFRVDPNQPIVSFGGRHVCFGSKAAMCGAQANVRFTPESGDQQPRTKSAKRQSRTFAVCLVIFIPSDADCDDRRDDWIFERKK